MPPRKICVVTGTRAEYGLLYWLLREIQDDPELELQLLVTGMHLSPEFGLTSRSIEADGFPVAERVEMLLSSDTRAGITKSLGLGVIGFADAVAHLRPDVLVLLGDRFEVLAAAQAALLARIPVAHIHGGETTEGAFDESIRHAITKMSHLHFAATADFRRRILQMGEAPEYVFDVGAPGLDYLARVPRLSVEELEQSLDGFRFGDPAFLVTYHPVTLASHDVEEPVRELLAALDRFPEAHVLITKSNADPAGRRVNELLAAWAAAHPNRVRLVDSLGQQCYLSAMEHASLVVGNSSSGIIEAPALHTPTVNVGLRQRGRPRAPSVIDCAEERDAIEAALRRALSPAMRAGLSDVTSPYGDGDSASARIKQVLKTIPLGDELLMKRFRDLECSAP